MQRLEVSGAVRLIYLYRSLGVKGLISLGTSTLIGMTVLSGVTVLVT